MTIPEDEVRELFLRDLDGNRLDMRHTQHCKAEIFNYVCFRNRVFEIEVGSNSMVCTYRETPSLMFGSYKFTDGKVFDHDPAVLAAQLSPTDET